MDTTSTSETDRVPAIPGGWTRQYTTDAPSWSFLHLEPLLQRLLTIRERPVWTHESTIEATASPAAIWKLFADVSGWKRWNAGIEHIEIQGPFTKGTLFFMQPPGDEGFTSTLIEVSENVGFTDETILGENRVVVQHRIVPLSPGRTKIIYSTEIYGPDAALIGPMVTGDFNEVLAALKALAESDG